MAENKTIDTIKLAQKVGSKYLLANALAKRAIQLENRARRRLEFENKNAITKAIEELDEGAIEVEKGGTEKAEET